MLYVCFLLGNAAVIPKVDLRLTLGRNKGRSLRIYLKLVLMTDRELGVSFPIESGSRSDNELTSSFSPLLHVH